VQLVQRHERALSAALAAEKRRRRRSAEHRVKYVQSVHWL
jgi:hypothetical protein